MGQLPYGVDEEKQPEMKAETRDFSLKEAIRTSQFWVFFVMLFGFGFCAYSLTVHLVPHITGGLGISPAVAANVLATFAGVGVLGNFLLGGLVGDKMGSRMAFIISFILMGASLLWLGVAGEAWMLYIFALVFGFSLGGMGTSESPLAARLFGLRSHGLIFGVSCLGYTSGAAVGPIVTGYIYDVAHSYHSAFLICAAFCAVGFILSVILRPTKRLGLKI
jgi:OFA family oxalate/formate antiporter-like MFS transporter